MKLTEEEAWREQCRQQLERDVGTRMKYGFCHVHKPVLDDAPFLIRLNPRNPRLSPA